jgi:hypothetical protein
MASADLCETLEEMAKNRDGIVSGVDKLYGVPIWKSNYCFICTWYYSNIKSSTGKRYFIFIGFAILVYIYIWMS